MLKFSLVLTLALGFTIAHHFTGYHHESHSHQRLMNVTELIASEGYPVENYTVTTKDGYELNIIRIPHGVDDSQYGTQKQRQYADNQFQYQSQSSGESNYRQSNRKTIAGNPYDENSESENSNSSEEDGTVRPAVFLMHGMLSSAEDYVLGGPTQALAYVLADNGFDVFLGNARGSTYGRKHTVLDPDRDAAFWKYCWDDIGMKDLPAMIDKILEITEQQKIYYVGHMEGSTAFLVMASEKPEYNDKIQSMVALGPMAFMGQSTNVMLRLVSEKMHSKGWVIRHLGANEFKPSPELIAQGGESDCMSKGNNEKICQNAFFLLNGYNSKNLNTTSIMPVINRVPSGTSTKQILHFAQLIKSGRFAKYTDGNEQPEDYDLSKIRTPIVMFYTPHDSSSELVDVDKLSRKLTTLKQSIRVERLTNNLDLIFGNNVIDYVYRVLVKILKNIDANSDNNV